MSRFLRLAFAIVPLVLAVAALGFLSAQRFSAPASATGPASMVIEVGGNASSCDDFDNPTKCTVDSGRVFTVSARVESLPPASTGYAGWQSLLYYDELQYNPEPDPADEVVWPDSALPLRSPAAPGGHERVVGFADVTSQTPPLEASTYLGNLLSLRLMCSNNAQTFQLALIAYDAAEQPLGSAFSLSDADGGGVVPAKVDGQKVLDLDTNPETDAVTVDVADSVTINCGGPTATPIPPGPDLSLQSLRVELETGGACSYTSTNLGVRIVVENEGVLDAGPFSLDVNGDRARISGGLASGEKLSLWFPGYNNGENTVEIDVLDEIVEMNEDNNSEVVVPAIPTLPAPCTPTPRPPGEAGDADCSGTVNAVDAALILQLIAALTDSLDCEHLADVNDSDAVDAIDVTLILQFTAGLLDEL